MKHIHTKRAILSLTFPNISLSLDIISLLDTNLTIIWAFLRKILEADLFAGHGKGTCV